VPERVIANALTGERIVIRRGAAETDGALLEFDLYLPPGGHVPDQVGREIVEQRGTVGRRRSRRVAEDASVTDCPYAMKAQLRHECPQWTELAGDGPVHAHPSRIQGQLQSGLGPAGMRVTIPPGLEDRHIPRA